MKAEMLIKDALPTETGCVRSPRLGSSARLRLGSEVAQRDRKICEPVGVNRFS